VLRPAGPGAKVMMVKRREFVSGAGGVVGVVTGMVACGLPLRWSLAQTPAAPPVDPGHGAAAGTETAVVAPVELEDFVVVDKPLAVTLPPGKRVELIEFFWYECPHCYAFEPVLVDWLRTLPGDVLFRHVPVGYTRRHEPAQQLYCALQLMGQAEALHGALYDAIHRRYRRIDFEWQMVSLVSSLGGDGARLRELLGSPEVAAAMRRANTIVDAFEVDGVPAFGIQGRYRTSPAMAGSRERALKVAEVLMERARRPV
jgi:thiol:disulfide interchange protein DsbA